MKQTKIKEWFNINNDSVNCYKQQFKWIFNWAFSIFDDISITDDESNSGKINTSIFELKM